MGIGVKVYILLLAENLMGRRKLGKTSEEGKQLTKWIADSIIAAAEKALFNFPLKQPTSQEIPAG